VKAIEQHRPHKGYTDIVRNLLETWAGKIQNILQNRQEKFGETCWLFKKADTK
jgi:hypothetical protein